MSDQFEQHSAGLESPARRAFAITPTDAATLAVIPRALFVGGAGNLSVIMVDDTAAVLLKNLAAGTLLPFRVKEVRSTSTTATDIVGLA